MGEVGDRLLVLAELLHRGVVHRRGEPRNLNRKDVAQGNRVVRRSCVEDRINRSPRCRIHVADFPHAVAVGLFPYGLTCHGRRVAIDSRSSPTVLAALVPRDAAIVNVGEVLEIFLVSRHGPEYRRSCQEQR